MLYLFLMLLMISLVNESVDIHIVIIIRGDIGVEEFSLMKTLKCLLQYDLFIYYNGGTNLLSQY